MPLCALLGPLNIFVDFFNGYPLEGPHFPRVPGVPEGAPTSSWGAPNGTLFAGDKKAPLTDAEMRGPLYSCEAAKGLLEPLETPLL